MGNTCLVLLFFILYQVGMSQVHEDTSSTRDESAFVADSMVSGLMLEVDSRLVPYRIQELKPDVFSRVPRINFFNSLAGKVAGMNLLRAQGGIEASSRLVFRGNRSLNQNNQPLIVLDGIPLHNQFDLLDPQDFQRISLLGGATAAAIYGNRAQNGAILIETKNGTEAISVRYTTSFIFDFPDPLLQFQRQYGQGFDLKYDPQAVFAWGPRMEGQEVVHWSPDPNQSGLTYSFKPGFELKDFLRWGHRYTSHLSIAGKAGPIRSYFSYGFTDGGGILPNNNLTRHQALLRLGSRIFRKLSLDARIQVISQDLQNPLSEGMSRTNPYFHAYRVPPNISNEDLEKFEYRDEQGALRQHFWAPGYNMGGNPYWILYRNTRTQKSDVLLTMLNARYQLGTYLALIFRSGYEKQLIKKQEKLFNDTYIIARQGRYSTAESDLFDENHELFLTYSRQLNRNFNLQSIVGAGSRGEKENFIQLNTGEGLIIPNLFTLENTNDLQTTTEGYGRKVHSVFTRHELTWKKQFRLELGMRNDWSSTLLAGSRSQAYPFLASSFILSEIINLPRWMNMIKLRTAFSRTGNDFAPYQLHRKLLVEDDVLVLDAKMPDKDLKPESTHASEIGLDLQFFNRRLQIWTTYYRTITSDHLIPLPLPVAAGAETILTNAGKVENKGIELSLYLNAFEGKNVQWEMFLQFSRNRNKVIKLHPSLLSYRVDQTAYHYYAQREGFPWGQIYSSYGFKRNAQGQIIVDHSGRPLTEVSETFVANMNPSWLAGLQQVFKYKRASIAFTIDIRKGGSLLSVTDNLITSGGFSAQTLPGREEKVIFGKNLFENETAMTETGEINNREVSGHEIWSVTGGCCAPLGDVWAKSASNARLRDLSISYVPDLTNFGFIKKMEISLVGENLFFLFNEAKIIDPEVIYNTSNQGVGWEMYSPPPVRSFGMNLKIEM